MRSPRPRTSTPRSITIKLMLMLPPHLHSKRCQKMDSPTLPNASTEPPTAQTVFSSLPSLLGLANPTTHYKHSTRVCRLSLPPPFFPLGLSARKVGSPRR